MCTSSAKTKRKRIQNLKSTSNIYESRASTYMFVTFITIVFSPFLKIGLYRDDIEMWSCINEFLKMKQMKISLALSDDIGIREYVYEV